MISMRFVAGHKEGVCEEGLGEGFVRARDTVFQNCVVFRIFVWVYGFFPKDALPHLLGRPLPHWGMGCLVWMSTLSVCVHPPNLLPAKLCNIYTGWPICGICVRGGSFGEG